MSWTTEELKYLYSRYTLREIAYLLGWGYNSKAGVRKLLQSHGIELRPRGQSHNGHNRAGTGFTLPDEDLDEGSHGAVAEKHGVSIRTVENARKRQGATPRKQKYTQEWQTYNSRVRRLTEQVYEANKHILNPKGLPRGLMGTKGAYQIDHIKSVRDCYNAGLPPESCASINNLQFISWEDNLARRRYYR